MKATKPVVAKAACYLAGCGKPARAKGLCEAHYMAHHVRKHPLNELAADLVGGAPVRIRDGVQFSVRVTPGANKRLEAAVKAGEATTRYALASRILEDWAKEYAETPETKGSK